MKHDRPRTITLPRAAEPAGVLLEPQRGEDWLRSEIARIDTQLTRLRGAGPHLLNGGGDATRGLSATQLLALNQSEVAGLEQMRDHYTQRLQRSQHAPQS